MIWLLQILLHKFVLTLLGVFPVSFTNIHSNSTCQCQWVDGISHQRRNDTSVVGSSTEVMFPYTGTIYWTPVHVRIQGMEVHITRHLCPMQTVMV